VRKGTETDRIRERSKGEVGKQARAHRFRRKFAEAIAKDSRRKPKLALQMALEGWVENSPNAVIVTNLARRDRRGVVT